MESVSVKTKDNCLVDVNGNYITFKKDDIMGTNGHQMLYGKVDFTVNYNTGDPECRSYSSGLIDDGKASAAQFEDLGDKASVIIKVEDKAVNFFVKYEQEETTETQSISELGYDDSEES